jgi:hydroxyacylglutathione hydrolase
MINSLLRQIVTWCFFLGQVFAEEKMRLTELLQKVNEVDQQNLECGPTRDLQSLEEEKKLKEKTWYAGMSDCNLPGAQSPPFEVHEVNKSYFIIRQNKCLNFEAPFLYLFLGEEKAFLLDTGATGDETLMPLREWIDQVLKSHPKGEKLPLIVAHSHSHGDHVAGDQQFKTRPHTTIVGYTPEEVSGALGITPWPEGIGEVDLGGRKLSILPIPGHEASSIAVYDHASRDLLSGDTLYPGNIFLSEAEFGDFKKSVERLHRFSQKNPLRMILGAHIEMSSTPGVGYPYGSTYHPQEHRLPLTQENLDELKTYLEKNPPARDKTFNDFRLTF